jgi:hypothetical protein
MKLTAEAPSAKQN